MAVAVIQETPDIVTVELYDAVNEKLDAYDTPPQGLLVHAAGAKEGGGFRIVDIWESAEDMERFTNERLRPAIEEVAGGDAPEADPPLVYELHDFAIP